MTQRSPAQWNLCRFLKTLSYFEVVPIFGNLRWAQQLLGHDPDPTPTPGAIAPDLTSEVSDLGVKTAGLIGVNPQVEPHLVQALQAQGIQVRSWATASEWILSQSQSHAQLPDTLFLQAEAPTAPDEDSLTSGSLTASLTQIEQSLTSIGDRRSYPDPLSSNALKLVNFQTGSDDLQTMWGAVDDVVMGGVSESNIRQGESVAIFSGVVSTANSGGFASVRTRIIDPPLDLSAFTGIMLQVKGDGQRYKVLIRDDARWDGVAYSYSFDTDAERWLTIYIPFSDLIPVFRAKTRNDMGVLDTRRIQAFQLMLSKFEYDGALNPTFRPGPFQLQIESISAYSDISMLRLMLLSQGQNPACNEAIRAIAHRLKLSYSVIQYGTLTQAPQEIKTVFQAAEPLGNIWPADLANLCATALRPGQLYQQTLNSILTVTQPSQR